MRLQLILRAGGIGPRDEVIVPAFTFVATALGVSLAGATPVLVDVRREDGLIDPDRIEAAITPRTRPSCPCTFTAAVLTWIRFAKSPRDTTYW